MDSEEGEKRRSRLKTRKVISGKGWGIDLGAGRYSHLADVVTLLVPGPCNALAVERAP
ncbi:MAG: hypothetical protein QXH02_03015 [Desulfurococcaceae archaeon]